MDEKVKLRYDETKNLAKEVDITELDNELKQRKLKHELQLVTL